MLAILGTALPTALRTFLLTLAVVDDLLAITIIAVFYTADLHVLPLALAAPPLALFAVLVQRRRARASEAGAGARSVAMATRGRGAYPVLVTAAKVTLGGAVVGFLTGFLGVGGGFLVVPALVIMLRMPMTLAIGTSLLIIALNSASSMISRIGVVHLDWRIILPFTLGAVAGTLAGKRIADRLSGRVLGLAFAWLLVTVGLFVGIQNLLVI